MSRGPDDIIREYLETNSTLPASSTFNVPSWQYVAEEIIEALEAEDYLSVHRDLVRTRDELVRAITGLAPTPPQPHP